MENNVHIINILYYIKINTKNWIQPVLKLKSKEKYI